MRPPDDARFDAHSQPAWSEAGEAPVALADAAVADARYRRGHVLGAGGMGRVTQVFDRHLGREVAMKELIARSPSLERRFTREAIVTARLDHPSIVPVHDIGRRDDGSLYYTMRVVRGRSLADAIAAEPDHDARLSLLPHVLAACEAVAFAHRHGVVHRDIKPANIMIGEFGETQVVDWGLARVLASPDDTPDLQPARDDELTQAGAILGTPRYLSPEVAAGAPATPRSDVWALGLVLAEVCGGPELTQAPGELAAVVNRALAASPEARYPDAKALAADLGRYLAGRRVTAHSYSTWELVRRVVRAWRIQLGAALLSLVAIAIAVALAFGEVEDERERAVAAEASTSAALARADRSLARMLASEAIGLARDDARPEAEIVAAHALALGESPEARGVLASFGSMAAPELLAVLPLPEACVDVDVAVDLSELACRESGSVALYRLDGEQLRLRWRRPAPSASGVTLLAAHLYAASTAGHGVIAWARADGAAQPPRGACCGPPSANQQGTALAMVQNLQLSVVTPERVLTLPPCPTREELTGAIDARGERWATTCRDGALTVGTLDGEVAGATRTFTTPLVAPRGPAAAIAFIDAEDLLLGGTDGRVVRYDLTRGVRYDLDSGLSHIRQIAVSPDRRWAAVLGDRSGVRLLDVASGTWRGRLPRSDVRRLRFVAARDAELVTLGPSLMRWRLAPSMAQAWSVADGVTGLVFAPSGDTLAVTRGKGVELRRLSDGAALGAGEPHDVVTKPGAFTADGATLATASASARRVTLWQVEPFVPHARELVADHALRQVTSVRIAAVPRWLALPYASGLVVWLDDARPHTFGHAHGACVDIAVSPDGADAWVLSATGSVVHLAVDTLTLDERFVVRGAQALAVLGDDVALVRAAYVEVYTRDGALTQVLHAKGSTLISVALSADGRWLAAGDREGRAFLWDRDGRLVASFHDHTRRVAALAFDPSSRWLATGSWDQTVRLRTVPPSALTPSDAERRWGTSMDAILSRP